MNDGLTAAVAAAVNAAPCSLRALAREASVPHPVLVGIRQGQMRAGEPVGTRVALALRAWATRCSDAARVVEAAVKEERRRRRAEPADSGRRQYRASRGGHAPGHIRDAFSEWVDDGMPKGRIEVGDVARAPEWVYGQLWNCTDVLPGDLCTQLDLPVGSTYAQAVRKLAAEDR